MLFGKLIKMELYSKKREGLNNIGDYLGQNSCKCEHRMIDENTNEFRAFYEKNTFLNKSYFYFI